VLRDWRRFVAVAAGAAVAIEAAQYAGSLAEGFTYRVTDVDDAIMNAGGAILVFLLWPPIKRVWDAHGTRSSSPIPTR
jgi:glycopeptide antibiotics resistance protein